MSPAECKEKLEQIRKELSIKAVVIRGATGVSANQINGLYKCRTKNFSIKKLFYRCKNSAAASDIITLAYDVSGHWLVGQTLRNCSDTLVLAYSEKSEATDPSDVQRWFVSNSSGSFTVQPCMKVTHCDADSASKGLMPQKQDLQLPPSCKGDKMMRITTSK